MLVRFGKRAEVPAGVTMTGEWKTCQEIFSYAPDDLTHVYEDTEYLILVDSSVTKSSSEKIAAEFDKLLLQIKSRSNDYGLFQDSYFIVVFDKRDQTLQLLRDPSGIKAGYYAHDDEGVWVGTLVHDIARASQATEFNEEALYQLLYTFYLSDGFTFYDKVEALKIGQRLLFDQNVQLLNDESFSIDLAEHENDLTLEQNAQLLRRDITETMKRQACDDNVVLLSGGIDSVVMLAALNELDGNIPLRSVSYRVKGTDQDETGYAMDIADHLKLECQVIEVDPEDEEIGRTFDKTILSMNNPYYGVWVFGKFDAPTLANKFFAGQDTRLHTPDMNLFHEAAFSIHLLRKNPILNGAVAALHWLTRPIRAFDLNCYSNRWIKGVGRLFELFDLGQFIQRFIFHQDSRAFKKAGLSLKYFDQNCQRLRVDLEGAESVRQIYNQITRVRWRNQFIDNIRYLDDLARLNRTYLAVPFYDPQLALANSSLPMRQATRTVVGRDKYSQKKALINKYLLRLAYKDKLTDKAYYRQKAVSMTLHLLFEGTMGRRVREIISEDLAHQDSFLKRFDLLKFIARFERTNSWEVGDFRYLLNVYYLATLCLYNRAVLTRTKSNSEAVAQTLTNDI